MTFNGEKMIFEQRGNVLFIDHQTNVGKKELEKAKRNGIKKLVTLTSGTDHVDVIAAKKLGFAFKNHPGINAQAVVQWALKQALDYCYSKAPPIEMWGKNIVIIGGAGKIGKKLTAVLSTFAHCSVYDQKIKRGQGTAKTPFIRTLASLKKALPKNDFVFLCIPLTSKNNGWFGKDVVKFMKTGSCLISISRPQIISEKAQIFMAARGITFIWDEKHVAWLTRETLEKQHKEMEKEG